MFSDSLKAIHRLTYSHNQNKTGGYIGEMTMIVEDLMQIGVRELRDSLSRHLAEVRAGRTITVTDHGRPIAKLVPVQGPSAFDRLVNEGRIVPARRSQRVLPEPIATRGGVSDLIAEQRG